MKMSFLLIFSISTSAFSFPDTIRHGYVNCTSCHISPSGGGLINSYGRSLSRELLSTWGKDEEEKNTFFDLAKLPSGIMDKFLIGGDARYISRRQNTQVYQVDEGFLMQAQLRLGLEYSKFKFITALGKIYNPRTSQKVRWVSPEYYTIYSPQESLHFRAGRFEPVFALRLPDHNLWVKSELGFLPWNERDTIETIYEGETQFLSVAGFQSTSTISSVMQTTGYTVNFDQIIYDTTRVGLSAMNLEGQGLRQKTLGGHGIISWTEKLFSMFDYSRVWSLDAKKDVAFFRTGYEIYKGINPFVQYQAKIDRYKSANNQKRYGVGLSWLPRPHIEIVLQAEKTKSQRGDSNENFVLLHFYL